MAQLAERGPELVGQECTGFRLVEKPTIGHLDAGDHVFTANETQRILKQNEIVEGRIVQRTYQQDMEQQTARLRAGASAQRQAEQAAVLQSSNQLLHKLDQVRRAIEEQEYQRLNENGDLGLARKKQGRWQHTVSKRYRRGYDD